MIVYQHASLFVYSSVGLVVFCSLLFVKVYFAEEEEIGSGIEEEEPCPANFAFAV